MITLEGLVSTYGDRAARLVLPPPRPGLGYVVVHQSADAGPPPEALIARPDVTYLTQGGRGLSRSRNAALEAASADHLFVLDDDVAFDPEAAARVAALAAAEGADVATYYHRWTDGSSSLPAGARTRRLGRVSVGSVTSIDLSITRDALRTGVRFDTDFGLGARYASCEEAVFLGDCLRAGLRVLRFPIEVCTHPPQSSGLDFYSSRDRVVPRRKMMGRIFGPAAPLFVAAFWAKKLPAAARAGHAGTFTRNMLLP
jgi:glycosyltransferase involved in cell wall biosynthesis